MQTKNLKRDKEYIFGYPPVSGEIGADEIWGEEPEKKEIAFYIHIPFCESICKYCPFNKYPLEKEAAGRYLSALKEEIEMVGRQSSLRHATVVAGYFGGGTPTCLEPGQLSDLIAHCRRNLPIHPRAELSMEANPGAIDKEKLAAMSAAGINRINFGVQSFDDEVLRMLGCRHRAEQAENALGLASEAGFTDTGIDLLYRLPGQTLSQWESQITYAGSLNVTHITTPELSIDPGTALYEESRKGQVPPPPTEEETIAMYKRGCEILTASGYHHYLMGYDFSLTGKECRYHRMSWQAPQKEIIGLGAGAYSYVNGAAYFNAARLVDYIGKIQNKRLPLTIGKKLSPQEKMARYMVHGIYFVKVDKKSFAELFHIEMNEVYGDIINGLSEAGLINDRPGEIELTPKGKIYVNNIGKAFYEEKYKTNATPPGENRDG